jgi:hypothetical protein
MAALTGMELTKVMADYVHSLFLWKIKASNCKPLCPMGLWGLSLTDCQLASTVLADAYKNRGEVSLWKEIQKLKFK